MDATEYQARMWADLFTSEMSARNATDRVTERALLYQEAGLPLEQVLDALKCSRATWYRRVQAHDAGRTASRTWWDQHRASTDARERQDPAAGAVDLGGPAVPASAHNGPTDAGGR